VTGCEVRKKADRHWVCFACRKVFRKPSHSSTFAYVCPQCRVSMTDMGTYFEPPKQSNRRMWDLMKALADSGYRFCSEGSRYWLCGGGTVGTRGASMRTVMSRIRRLLRRPRAVQ